MLSSSPPARPCPPHHNRAAPARSCIALVNSRLIANCPCWRASSRRRCVGASVFECPNSSAMASELVHEIGAEVFEDSAQTGQKIGQKHDSRDQSDADSQREADRHEVE